MIYRFWLATALLLASLLFLSLAACAGGPGTSTSVAPTTSATSPISPGTAIWPMFRYDAQHGGRSMNPGPDTGTVEWAYTTTGTVFSSPAIAADGSVVFGSEDGKLYALDRQGELLWSFQAGGPIFSSPAIASDGTVYVGSDDGNLYAVDPTGRKKWVFTLGDRVRSSPTIGPE
jgi:outer membrane protein assembly factor BamB